MFTNPVAIDRKVGEVGEDIFPRDFIVQLLRPDGYTGPEELFGVGARGRDVLLPVASEDVLHPRSRRRGRGGPIVVQKRQQLPQSLCDALLSFCLAGTTRTLRGITGEPHTVLVHVSHEQRDQLRIGGGIQDQIQAWRDSEDV